MMKKADKEHIIDLMFKKSERDEMFHLPDQWGKRNQNIVNNGIENRYLVRKDGQVVDLYHQSYITLRMTLIRLSELLTLAKNYPNDSELGSKVRKEILDLENEFNISEIQ